MMIQFVWFIDCYFFSYFDDYCNVINQCIYVIVVLVILWLVIVLLWCLLLLIIWFQFGVWVGLVMFVVWCYYNCLLCWLGYGMLVLFFVSVCLCCLLEVEIGLCGLFWLGLGVFVVVWVVQFIGYMFEGCKFSFFIDLVYLLIGLVWVMVKVYCCLNWCF